MADDNFVPGGHAVLNPTTTSRTILFTDLRHIRCGDLEWFSPSGERLPLIRPPEPQVEACARSGFVSRGVRLVAQTARKTEPLALPKGLGTCGRIMFESGSYRGWRMRASYRPGRDLGAYSQDVPETVEICHAESRDGFEWRETLRCPINVPGQSGFDGFALFVDPKGNPEERYKAVYCARPPEEDRPGLWEKYEQLHPRHRDLRVREDYVYCMYAAVSPDGLHWSAVPQPLMVHISDTDTTVDYDEGLGKFVMLTRLYIQERRWIGRAEADDFHHWGPVERFLWPTLEDPPSTDIYTNGRTDYPGLPQYHLMFPMFYHRFDQRSDVRLFSSEDGLCWNRVPGGPVLIPGEAGEWDSEYLYTIKDLVPLGSDRVGVMCQGTRFPHKYPRWQGVLDAGRTAWAWWPKERLCAVMAEEEGEFFTFPMVPAGRELRLNVRTRRAGMVQVGVVGAPDRAADQCDPIVGDGFALPVHWRGQPSIGAPEGQAVTLHLKLRAAELFAIEWE
ncbi:MAG: hypothetical protein HY318_09555 [Armatimonadetes bacterium]|nr:hypothetical protein [Armatimonadota bacterium]